MAAEMPKMPDVKEEDVDNNILIEEVKLRPSLYDRCRRDYSCNIQREKMWEEVAIKVFKDMWWQYSQEQKMQAGKLIKKKWVNMRNCFSRELRDIIEQGSKKRRKYIYYDKLLFLRPSMRTRGARGKVTTRESGGENAEEIMRCTCTKISSDEECLLETSPEKKRETECKDQETNFALSLVPMLKALPQDQKLDVQIGILQVFRNVTKSQQK